jgi:hypothetical protein
MQSLSSLFFRDPSRGISLPVKIATHSIARLSSHLAALRLVAWNDHAASLRLASRLGSRTLERVQPGFQG